MEALKAEYSVHALCDAMCVSRGTFYNHLFRSKRDKAWFVMRDKELSDLIRAIHTEADYRYGANKIAAVLHTRGVPVTDKKVRQLMQQMNLKCIRCGAKRIYVRDRYRFKNLVNGAFNPDTPNQIWVSDVTEFQHKSNKFYLCVVLDLFSRKVIAYRLSMRNSTHLVKMTIRDAVVLRKPPVGLIFHSDRGANYTSFAFWQYLRKQGIVHSLSRPHTPTDNSVMESFFNILKTEELYRRRYHSVRELKASIGEFIEFYNSKRPHQALGMKAPDAVE